MHEVSAKKSLGQHFLADRNIARKIVESLLPGNYETLVEIGPGTGVLTRHLLQIQDKAFLAVELDKEAFEFLNRTFTEHASRFVLADFLKYPLDQLKLPVALIGNFPYYISSQIFFKALEHRDKVTQIVCMIQKEVAERIAEPPGSKKYGILSVLLQAYFNIDYLFTVHERCFSPAPKVKSAVIRLVRNDRSEVDCNPDLFFKVIKASFNQRRKVIRNSLKSVFDHMPEDSSLLSLRPEQLNIEQFIELTRQLEALNL